MKMMKQNARLTLVGFIQVIFMATAGTSVAEILKSERTQWIMTAASTIAVAALIVIIVIYFKAFAGLKKRKR
jgi:uncharacterized membrane protein